MSEKLPDCLEVLHKLLEEGRKFDVSNEDEEKDIFSLGGRGHYENPISDILAFFLNPQEQHQFGYLFLASLFECLKLEEKTTITDVKTPQREARTENGNRIDLLIESKDEIIVIENKIYHWLANPLGDYRNYVENKFKNKAKYLIVLALSTTTPSNFTEIAAKPGWKVFYVSYREYLDSINKNIGTYFMRANNNKWLVIIREFQLNLERMIKMDQPIEKEKIEFVAKNTPQILMMWQMWNQYLDYIRRRIIDGNADMGKYYISTVAWGGDGTALRIYDENNYWEKYANITVVIVKKTGSYRVGVYLPNIKESDLANIHTTLNDDNKLDEYWEGRSRSLWTKDDFKELECMFSEARRLIDLVNKYYKKNACVSADSDSNTQP